MYVPDNYDAWKEHDERQSKALQRQPVCDNCDEPIQDDHYYLINGDNICPDCMETHFRKEVDI